MMVLDVNVLVAAFRQDHPHHARTLPWWERQLAAGSSFCVPDDVWSGFVRVVTSTRIFTVPATASEAFAFVDATRQQSGYSCVPSIPGLLDLFGEICRSEQASGDLVPDAYIAAVARSLGAAVATFDRDFRRFDHLRTVAPEVS
ncbi:MAG: PIN domain-containing protein [Actinomycetota bacterium]|nr:PIN domain-containing protein [Actinomycetota bacterium]